jgi:hypothetical protein
MVNRTQALVIGFFAVAWVSLLVIVAVAPEVYDRTLQASEGDRAVEVAFVVVLSAFIALLAFGVLRRWRWLFWLILAAFLAGLLRVAASVLELTGTLPAQGPAWYTVYQAALGVAQFSIALAMLVGYRRRGVWGAY